MSARFALYYAPATDDPLWQSGSAWLGRDAATGHIVARPAIAPPDPTVRPALYGFHATLKPPFRLRQGTTAQELVSAAQAIASATPAFELPKLHVGLLGPYLALVPAADCPPLRALAARLVQELDRFRAEPTPQEMARRRSVPLSAAQERLLELYGYPDVLDQWRFHMTLSERLPADHQNTCLQAAEAFFSPILADTRLLAELCVFIQPAEGEPFRIAERLALDEAR